MPVVFNPDLCDMNPYCPATRMCPTGAMFLDRKTLRPTFDADKCTGCARCVSSCPHNAIREE